MHRRLLRVALILLQLLVGLFVASALAVLVVPRAMGWRVENVQSGSMTPTYPIYTVLAIRPVDPDKIRVDDIIMFTVPGKPNPVAHRVIEVKSSGQQRSFITRGDANNTADLHPVPASAVKGRVAFGVPQLGRLVAFVHTRAGLVALFLLPVALLVLPTLFRRQPKRQVVVKLGQGRCPATSLDDQLNPAAVSASDGEPRSPATYAHE